MTGLLYWQFLFRKKIFSDWSNLGILKINCGGFQWRLISGWRAGWNNPPWSGRAHAGELEYVIWWMFMCSVVPTFMTSWTVAHQTLLSTGFSRQEHQSGLSFPPPGDFPDPGIEPTSSVSSALRGRFFIAFSTILQ